MAKRLLSFTLLVQGVNVSAVTDPLEWDHVEPAAARRLLTGAIEAFAERGFQATTTRDIASRAGMSPAALYVHYPSKERLLFEISLYGHNAALAILRSANVGDTPADRLRSLVAAFTAWHARHHTIAHVVQYELGALSPDHLTEVATIRRAISTEIEQVLADGVQDGTFAVPDLPGTTLAVLSLSIDVARWYTPHRGDPDALGKLYADLAHRMVQS
ncbi:TetR/AcrR family transcriptional regulator [Kribbella albertanoniae]|uniref:TetR/AcrR family transcriptional regulator n=1 Tax=Kribbella albertanoniae TaxID=1266829 RepID=A0A4R4Q7H3_9ACTN|nr:TetR/AcrR family transcriptional regulator [Kribbella albertanoniae]